MKEKEEEKKTVEEQIELIKRRISPNYLALNRVPVDVRKGFIEFAEEKFCKDRGMAFKHIWDFYTGILNAGTEHLETAMLEFNERLKVLEEKEEKKEPELKKRLDGSSGRKGEEQK